MRNAEAEWEARVHKYIRASQSSICGVYNDELRVRQLVEHVLDLEDIVEDMKARLRSLEQTVRSQP